MTILSLHHAQITVPVSGEAMAREFYIAWLGLREIDKPDGLKRRGGFWLQVGDRQVHVGLEDGVERSKTKAHLAYQVSDLAAWRIKLHEAEVGIVEGVPVPGMERLEFRDPFGNRVELLQVTDD